MLLISKEKSAIIFFVLLLVVFYAQPIFSSKAFYSRDISHYYRPTYLLATESIQRGIFPFWNPYSSCGTPFFAAVQHGLLYPLSQLNFLFPFEWGFKYMFILHFFIAGLGLYLLLRNFNLRPLVSLGGTILYCFGGCLVSLTNLLTSLIALSWLSFIFLFYQRTKSSSGLGWGWLCSAGLSLQFFGGQPEITYLSFLLLAVSGLGYAFKDFKNYSKILLFIVLSTGLLLLPEILPFLQLIKHSYRLTFSGWESQTYWSLHPLQLADLLSPSHRKNFLHVIQPQEWIKNIYVGIIPLFLLCFSMSGKRRKIGWCCALALVSLVLAFGKYTPLYKVITSFVPGLSMIRYPIKFFMFFNWCFIVLVVFGLQNLLEKSDSPQANRYVVFKSIMLLLLLVGIVVIGNSVHLWAKFWLHFILLSGFLLLTLMYRARLFNKNIFSLAIILTLFLSVSVFTFGSEELVPTSFVKHRGYFKKVLDTLDFQRYVFTPKTYAVLTGAAAETKSVSVGYNTRDLSLWESVPNMAMVGHQFIGKGYESIYVERFFSFYSLTSFQPIPSSSYLLNLIGVKFFVSLWEINDRELNLLDENVWKIYENKKAFPRAFITYDSVQTPHLPAVMDKLKDRINFASSAKILKYDINDVIIESEAEREATLVLADTFYPGWSVFIDGHKTNIFPAYYLCRGVTVPPGNHKVTFRYMPDGFIIGLILSLLYIVTGITFIFWKNLTRGIT